MADQLVLTWRTRRVDMRHIRIEQRAVVLLARQRGSISVEDVISLGYANGSAALCRLARRGLLRRVSRGVYEAVTVGERRAPQAR